MKHKTVTFDGKAQNWFSEIMTSEENLLLSAPGKEGQQLGVVSPKEKQESRYIGLYTSATTGTAKVIWNTFDRLMRNAGISAREFEITGDDRLLMLAKPWHVAGLSWALIGEYLNLDYRLIPTESGEEQRWYQAIMDFNPDYLLTVPEVLRRLFDFDDWFVSNIVYGGTPITDEDYRPLSIHAHNLYQGYGQTEAGGLISSHKIMTAQEIPAGSCYCYGYPPEEFKVQCEGTPKNPQPIWLQSPTAVYDGFYDTGDKGYMRDGKIFLRGRCEK